MRKGKGREAKLSYQANTLVENCNGLIVRVDVRHTTGIAERDGALDLVEEMLLRESCTVGADKGYDAEDFIAGLRGRQIKPHIAQNTKGRRSACARGTHPRSRDQPSLSQTH